MLQIRFAVAAGFVDHGHLSKDNNLEQFALVTSQQSRSTRFLYLPESEIRLRVGLLLIGIDRAPSLGRPGRHDQYSKRLGPMLARVSGKGP